MRIADFDAAEEEISNDLKRVKIQVNSLLLRSDIPNRPYLLIAKVLLSLIGICIHGGLNK